MLGIRSTTLGGSCDCLITRLPVLPLVIAKDCRKSGHGKLLTKPRVKWFRRENSWNFSAHKRKCTSVSCGGLRKCIFVELSGMSAEDALAWGNRRYVEHQVAYRGYAVFHYRHCSVHLPDVQCLRPKHAALEVLASRFDR